MIEIARILSPVDFSECSQHALAYAVAMARWYGSRITALHVFVNWPAVNVIPSLYPATVPPIRFESIREELMRHSRSFVQAAHATDIEIDVAVEEAPDLLREILEQADLLKADLIVMGSHGRGGVDRLLLGSTTEKVLRKAACPVMVVPPRAQEPPVSEPAHFHRILCPVDFSASSLAAVAYAMSLAEEADAQLTLLNAIEVPPGLYEAPLSAELDVNAIRVAAEADRLRRLEALVPDAVRTYCTVETAVSEGRASRAILRVATERSSDLIVMGVQGRGAFDLMLFGSNTHAVIRAAACPVLTVRGQGARS